MDVYSRLMDIDEVVECLNRKTDIDISFDKKKVLKLIENRIITIVFKFEGFVTWNCVSKGKYYSIEMSGYFNFTDESKAIGIFEGSLDEIPLSKAIIYHLDSPDIRGGAPDGIKPEKGDIVLFKTGGRPPALTPGLTPYLTTELSYLSIENFIKIYNNKVGVLKVDIEEYLKKKKIEAMENDTKMEALESKVEQLEAENVSLIEQLEEAKAKLVDRPTNHNSKLGTKTTSKEANSRSKDKKLIAIMAILLAKKSNVFQLGDRPNAAQINEAIFNLAQQELQIIDDDMFGLKANTAKISSAINEYLHIIKNKPE